MQAGTDAQPLGELLACLLITLMEITEGDHSTEAPCATLDMPLNELPVSADTSSEA